MSNPIQRCSSSTETGFNHQLSNSLSEWVYSSNASFTFQLLAFYAKTRWKKRWSFAGVNTKFAAWQNVSTLCSSLEASITKLTFYHIRCFLLSKGGSGLSYTLEFGILRYWTFVYWNLSDFCTGIWYIEALDFRIRLNCILEFRILKHWTFVYP